MQIDEEVARRAIEMVEEIHEQGFRRRAEEAKVEADRLGCGYTLTHTHGGMATAQIEADPEVPAGKANLHWMDKRPGRIVPARRHR